VIVRAPAQAFAFLTVVPLPRVATASDGLGRAVAAFPLVGALLGLLVGGIDVTVARWLPSSVCAALDLVLLAAITGGLHLDGVADAVDGLASGPDPTARLAAMRDSRIGALGAAALVLVLLVEYAALSAAPSRMAVLVVGLALSRWAMAIALWSSRPARSDGLGASFHRSIRTTDVIVATVFAGVLVGAIASMPLVAIALAAALIAAAVRVAAVRLGGGTGDVYGAIGEVVFAAVLCVPAA